MGHLLDLKRAVETAITILNTKEMRPISDSERHEEGELELEPGGIIVSGWYCARIKKV